MFTKNTVAASSLIWINIVNNSNEFPTKKTKAVIQPWFFVVCSKRRYLLFARKYYAIVTKKTYALFGRRSIYWVLDYLLILIYNQHLLYNNLKSKLKYLSEYHADRVHSLNILAVNNKEFLPSAFG